MSTDSIGGTASIFLANFYNANQSRLNDNLVRISSGKRFQSPGIHAADYFHAAAMRNDVSGLQSINREIVGATGMLKVAEQVGQSVFDDITRLKEIVKQYYFPATTDEEKTGLGIEFNTIKTRIVNAIGVANYDGKKLIADNGATPLRRVVLDSRDVSQTLDISYNAGDVADVGALAIGVTDQATELDAVEVQLGKSISYLAKTTVYAESLTAFYNMNNKKAITCSQNAEDTENIDGGAEAMELSKRQICQQMTVSMMAQANMVRSSVLALLGIK